VAVRVGVIVIVAVGVVGSPAAEFLVTAYVTPTEIAEKMNKSNSARGRDRVNCRVRPRGKVLPVSRSSVPHTTHRVAVSEFFVPQVGQIWLSVFETSSPSSDIGFVPIGRKPRHYTSLLIDPQGWFTEEDFS
jgi:hypothetical protein